MSVAQVRDPDKYTICIGIFTDVRAHRRRDHTTQMPRACEARRVGSEPSTAQRRHGRPRCKVIPTLSFLMLLLLRAHLRLGLNACSVWRSFLQWTNAVCQEATSRRYHSRQ